MSSIYSVKNSKDVYQTKLVFLGFFNHCYSCLLNHVTVLKHIHNALIPSWTLFINLKTTLFVQFYCELSAVGISGGLTGILTFEKLHVGNVYYVGSFITFGFIALWSIITFWDLTSWSCNYENQQPLNCKFPQLALQWVRWNQSMVSWCINDFNTLLVTLHFSDPLRSSRPQVLARKISHGTWPTFPDISHE